MTITLTTTFELADNVTLATYDTMNIHIGTMVIKDGKLKYHDLITKEVEEYDEDNLSEFEEFCNKKQLTFKKIKDRNYIEYQPNPKKNNTTDCTFRAYSKVENMTWDEAYNIGCEYGREMKLMPNDHKVVDKILKEKFGYSFTKFAKDEKKTVNEFAIEHPEGIYVGWLHGHIVAIVNGYYYDSWDSGDRKLKGYYKK